LEELVGSIQDEYDRETPDIVKIHDDEFIVAGNITTSDVEKIFAVDFSPMDIRSISGLFIEQLGHIPAAGEQESINGIEFTAEKIVDNAVESIRLRKLPSPSGDIENETK
jgi:putative hemolysin